MDVLASFHSIQASQPQFAWGGIIQLLFSQVTADKTHTQKYKILFVSAELTPA